MTNLEKVINGLKLLAHWPDGLIITDKEKWIKPCCEMAITLLKERNSCENCAIAIEDRQSIVRCKDCKWYDEQISMCNNCGLPREQTFFCADGKRPEKK